MKLSRNSSRPSRRFVRALVACSVGALVSTGLVACGADESPDTLRVGILPGSTPPIPDYVAMDQGFFDDRGIDIKLSEFASGPASNSAAMGGAVDVFQTAPPLLISANQQGGCLRFISSGQANMFTLIGQKDADLPNAGTGFPESVRDLEGLKVGVIARGSGSEYVVRHLLNEAGMDPESVKYVPTGGVATATAAFQAKRVDVLLAFPPVAESLPKDSYVSVDDLKDVPGMAEYMTGAMATTCDAWNEKETQVTKYCQGLWDAYDFMKDPKNADEVKKTMVKHLGMDTGTASAVWATISDTFPDAGLPESAWAAQQPFLPEEIGDVPSLDDSAQSVCASSDPR